MWLRIKRGIEVENSSITYEFFSFFPFLCVIIISQSLACRFFLYFAFYHWFSGAFPLIASQKASLWEVFCSSHLANTFNNLLFCAFPCLMVIGWRYNIGSPPHPRCGEYIILSSLAFFLPISLIILMTVIITQCWKIQCHKNAE